MIFTESDYDTLAAIVFRPDYPGNPASRGVVEAPNGDSRVDAQKRYSHVAMKYLDGGPQTHHLTLQDFILLHSAHEKAFLQARRIAAQLNVSFGFLPHSQFGALRVLEYPEGVGGHVHTDFDLFAVNLWRNVPNPGLGGSKYHIGEIGELVGLGPAEPHYVAPLPVVQKSLVYFCIPSHDAILPSGITVGAWLSERIARSRVAV